MGLSSVRECWSLRLCWEVIALEQSMTASPESEVFISKSLKA